MRRPLAWLVIAPFGAAGVLVGHAFAYRLTGTPPGEPHDYLAHAPQVLALLVLAAAGLASLIGRSPRACLWQFALAAPVAFVLQEHLERVVHTDTFRGCSRARSCSSGSCSRPRSRF